MNRPFPRLLPTVLLALLLPAAGHAACSSEGVRSPDAVLERFISADCADCWTDAATPKAGRSDLAIDWILPGRGADTAPLAQAARVEAAERLQALRRAAPSRSVTLRSVRTPGPARMQVALGQPVSDYAGVLVEVDGIRRAHRAWVLLVEELPAGTEGSPVVRRLVRGAFQVQALRTQEGKAWNQLRSMQLAEGVQPDRLRVIGLLEDARGRLVAAVRSRCRDR